MSIGKGGLDVGPRLDSSPDVF